MKKVVKKKAKAKKAQAKKTFIGFDTQAAQPQTPQTPYPDLGTFNMYKTATDAPNEPTFPYTNMFYNMRYAFITRIESYIIGLEKNKTPVDDLAEATVCILEEVLTDFDFKIVRKDNIRD